MTINATAEILIEPDDQYTTVVVYYDSVLNRKFSQSATPNQTLVNAFNKARDDMASLLTGGLKVQSIEIKARIE
jgi:hypothetical protein